MLRRRGRQVKKDRKGMTLVETVIALLLLSLSVVIMAILSGAKVDQQSVIESQQTLNAVDAFFYGIYSDFHTCETYELSGGNVTNPDGTITENDCILLFDLGDGVRRLYEYDANTGEVSVGGVVQFKCSSFDVRIGGNSVYVAIRLPSERVLEMDIFK